MNISQRKLLFFIFSLATLVLFFFLYVGLTLFRSSEPKAQLSPTPAFKTIPLTPPADIRIAPTLPPSRGTGLDISSFQVKQSEAEVRKLSPFLPYKEALTLSTGLVVDVVIPDQSLQANPWTLTVQVFGIDYQTTPSEPNYPFMKASFKEAALRLFSWMKEHNADHAKLFISWGDRAFIQQRATIWLTEK